ncbi:MAG: hypothetical protein M3487_03655 [Actinomycetota bacterium]|nr:hypothetical protein [Actinomycetota bacterium]
MPWCEECAKYFAPSAMTADGHCPRCDRDLDAPQMRSGDGEADVDAPPTPWHFKLMVVALVVYLGWRFVGIFG